MCILLEKSSRLAELTDSNVDGGRGRRKIEPIYGNYDEAIFSNHIIKFHFDAFTAGVALASPAKKTDFINYRIHFHRKQFYMCLCGKHICFNFKIDVSISRKQHTLIYSKTNGISMINIFSKLFATDCLTTHRISRWLTLNNRRKKPLESILNPEK